MACNVECSIQGKQEAEVAVSKVPRDVMVNSERAKVFMDQRKNDSFDDKDNREDVSTNTNSDSDSDTIFIPNLDRLIKHSQSYSQLPLPKGRRRHCSEGEVVVKEKVRRYRNRSVSDKDLEQVLGTAAWLLALADNNNLEAAKDPRNHDGSDACSSYERPLVRGLCGSAVDVSTLGTAVNMKGWSLSSTGHHRLAVPAGKSASCNTSPTKTSSTGRPLNKYAAILASVGCTPPSVAPCPLALLSGPRNVQRSTNCGTSAMSAVTWAHHTCCTTSTVTTTTHVKPNMTPKMAPSTEKGGPGSTKGIGSKSCSINLKTFSASFNCRTATSSLASSPTTSTSTRDLCSLPITSATITTTSTPVAAITDPASPDPGTVLPTSNDKRESKPSKTALKSASAKSSPSGSRKSKASPKTSRTSRNDSHGSSSKTKKSSKSSLSKAPSSSSKSSSSSSVATIDCETVSVNIPDRPMCVMTTSWTPDDDVMSPMSWTCERQITNQNESPSHDLSGNRFDRSWPESTGYIVDNSSVTYQGSILHSDSLSSEADEENNKMSASQKLRAALRDTQMKTAGDNSSNGDDSRGETTPTSTTSVTSPGCTNKSSASNERRPRPRPLSLPSNHKLDLKLCYFNPNIDTGLNDNSDSTIQHQRSSVDLELDLQKVKRHSSGLSNASADRWHSALHPLIHSQSQILQESELSKVAKVKILSRTSWCECSQEFLMTSLNQRHKCYYESASPCKEEEMSSSSQSSLAKNENGASCQCKDGESCSCCHGNDGDATRTRRDVNEMRIPKAPSDEFLTEAMKYTREKRE